MSKLVAALKSRILGSLTTTLGGALVGTLNLAVQAGLLKVDWSDPKQAAGTVLTSAVPIIVGAMYKGAPQQERPAFEQQIHDAIADAVQQAASSTIEKMVQEMKRTCAATPAPDRRPSIPSTGPQGPAGPPGPMGPAGPAAEKQEEASA